MCTCVKVLCLEVKCRSSARVVNSYANVNFRENNVLGALAKYLGGFPLVCFLILEAQDSGIVRFTFENILCTCSVTEDDLELTILLPVNFQGLEL